MQGVPLATEPGISLIILPLMRILQRNLKRTTDTFLFISHTTNVLLFKFRCNIFIGVRIIKEMPGSVASGTSCILSFGACVTLLNFATLSSKRHDFRKSYGTQSVFFFIFCTKIVWNICHSNKSWEKIWPQLYICFHVQYRYCCTTVMNRELSGQI